ncbi:M2 family metallopeptidase [Mechercharimyces sp. CAU 1602]|uniref:M2 family metallopeptidase n=1 Tax=Mechercharimyces sp. CAU 1602 TaxID=2973933 RepID=UPI0021637695|nr:M2 family metallopeptidase [Mechercharimyces sp. CAU 1602]MCS1351519.1 M2 family metallopeptidase [Mechercharimyces sp. CAU 1602]
MDEQAQLFIDEVIPKVATLERELAEANWEAITSGKKKYGEKVARKREALIQLFADPKRYEQFCAIEWEKIEDHLLKRQFQLLELRFLRYQMNEEDRTEWVALEMEIKEIFAHFRAQVGGKSYTDNDLKEALKLEKTNKKRKELWRASKQIGVEVEKKLLKLVKVRNRIAQAKGYRDYYQLSLAVGEMEEDQLFAVLQEVKDFTDEPYLKMKKEMDKRIAKEYPHLRPEGVRSWHYDDFFFQEVPTSAAVDVNSLFAEENLVALAEKTFLEMGWDVTQILSKSDLYEREGKSQHAYSFDIDRERDVRILCNLRSNQYWMHTLLHELGHAVYDTYRDDGLPYLLRTHAHICMTEAMAMTMGRLASDPAWLLHVLKVSNEEMDEYKEMLKKQQAHAMLILARWCLVMTHFERDLYADPEQDLNSLWWEYVERFQYVPKPEGRDAPDWAAKIHFSIAPAYYHNYLLGELIVSQWWSYLEHHTEGHPLILNQRAGEFFNKEIFSMGAALPWQDLLQRATGEKLNPIYFYQQFCVSKEEESADSTNKSSANV